MNAVQFTTKATAHSAKLPPVSVSFDTAQQSARTHTRTEIVEDNSNNERYIDGRDARDILLEEISEVNIYYYWPW